MEKILKSAARSLAEKVTTGKMADAMEFYAEVLFQVSIIKRAKERKDEAEQKAMEKRFKHLRTGLEPIFNAACISTKGKNVAKIVRRERG